MPGTVDNRTPLGQDVRDTSGVGSTMSYEYRSRHGLIRLVRDGDTWRIMLGAQQAGSWPSAEAAITAILRQASGIAALDRTGQPDVPHDLLRWTPLADNL